MKTCIFKFFITFIFLFSAAAFGSEEKCATPSHIGEKTLCIFVNDRPIVMDVWYPTKGGKPCQSRGVWRLPPVAHDAPLPESQHLPLILMSHGYGGERKELLWLAEELAMAGFLVVSVDHYGNTWKDPTPQGMIQVWNRPQEISFALDYLLEASPFAQTIDSSRVGFVGFSVGGMTGLWLAGAEASSAHAMQDVSKGQLARYFPEASEAVESEMFDTIDFDEAMGSYQDPRISHYALLAPRVSEFSTESLQAIEKPMLVIYGEEDAILLPRHHAMMLHAPNRQMLELPHVGHFVFLNQTTDEGKKILPPILWSDDLKQVLIHSQVAKEVILFFNTL